MLEICQNLDYLKISQFLNSQYVLTAFQFKLCNEFLNSFFDNCFQQAAQSKSKSNNTSETNILARGGAEKNETILSDTHFLLYKKLMSNLSTKSFLIFLLFSIVMRTMTYCLYIVIG